jgi:hypothetical protein
MKIWILKVFRQRARIFVVVTIILKVVIHVKKTSYLIDGASRNKLVHYVP